MSDLSPADEVKPGGSQPRYWLSLFTPTTWTEYLQAGARVTGFVESMWGAAVKTLPGDYLLCYIGGGASRWAGLLRISGKAFRDTRRIWTRDVYPVRLPVEPIITLGVQAGIPIATLKERLSFFRDMSSPYAWTGYLRNSLREIGREDAAVIIDALQAASRDVKPTPAEKAALACTKGEEDLREPGHHRSGNDSKDEVAAAIGILVDEIQTVIAGLKNEGAEAFRDGDYETAKKVADRVQRTESFLDRVRELAGEWERLSKDRRTRGEPRKNRKRPTRSRLPVGLLTHYERFRQPILRALVELGGTARARTVLERVLKTMASELNEFDREPLPSGGQRWQKTAERCRLRMVREGLLSTRPGRGQWEITDAGRREIEGAAGDPAQ